MKTKLFLLLFLTLLYANLFAKTSHQTVVELMKISGCTAIFQQLEEGVNAQIEQKKSSFKNEEEFNKFANAIKSGLNSKNAENYFLEYFELYTNEDSIRNVIRLYEQPFMQEMQKMELAANNPSSHGLFIFKNGRNHREFI
ncbi:MAG: hypothetical protein VB102_11395 [Paludibacter sp.]|nr:hypothetical protein [Paludibacter sp.]